MKYTYTWQGESGPAHPTHGTLVKGQVYTSDTELAGYGWAPYTETAKQTEAVKPGKEKNK